MIKELVQFTTDLGDFKEIGAEPKYGLYIQLKLRETDGYWSIDPTDIQSDVFSKKTAGQSLFLKKCRDVIQHAWMIDTWKCFDAPEKAIHTCSPYAIAFKKETLPGKEKQKPVGDRLERYFAKAKELLDDKAEHGPIDVFKNLLNSADKLKRLLDSVPAFSDIKDNEYVVLFLDEPIEKYQIAHGKYLKENLFNKALFTTENAAGETVGASGFFSGVPDKKPFLSHQTASFQISGRITLHEAAQLFEFETILKQGVLPRPLPIFIYQDELPNLKNGLHESIVLFKKEAEADPKKRRGFAEIMTDLHDNKVELGNFYLLFYMGGEVHDFDFVSKFEYKLDGWKVENLFEIKDPPPRLDNVFDLLHGLLIDLFDNSLVVRSGKKEGLTFRWFGEVESKYCRSASAYLMVLKYRQAFYDFIYKSRRQAINQTMFAEIAMAGILDGIRRDRYENHHHTEEGDIKRKLNLFFSLYPKFTHHKNLYHNENPVSTANQTIQLREFMGQLAKGEGFIKDDPQFAFAAGQVVRYLLSKSKSSDRSFARLEPFLQQTQIVRFLDAVRKVFETYKHEKFSKNFEHPFAEVTGYDTDTNLRDLTPLFLSGFFSKNNLFAKKEDEEDSEVIDDENED